nr:M56 family metallopeptidase [Pedobacter panaciterrae]
MEQLVIYLLKSSVCTSVFFGIYWCCFKNETFYRFNRYFLVTGILASLILPFYTYTYQVSMVSDNRISEPVQAIASVHETGYGWIEIALAAYGVIAVALLLRHVIGLHKIKRMVSEYGYSLLNGYKVVRTPVFKSSFSVFNYIIIDDSSESSDIEQKLILEHEQAHVRQFHWVDLLVAQLFCALQWFNPFAWMYLSAIKQNHEYLADCAVLEQGNSAVIYRAALINHSLGTTVFTLASSFSHFDKLKRVDMMMKPASRSVKKVAVLTVIPALAVFFWAFAEPKLTIVTKQTENKSQQDKKKIVRETSYSSQRKKPIKRKTSGSIRNKIITSTVKLKIKEQVGTQVLASDTVQVKMKPILLPEKESISSQPLIYLDGIEVSSIDVIDSKDIESINVFKGESAIKNYGIKGRNGVILVRSKNNPIR